MNPNRLVPGIIVNIPAQVSIWITTLLAQQKNSVSPSEELEEYEFISKNGAFGALGPRAGYSGSTVRDLVQRLLLILHPFSLQHLSPAQTKQAAQVLDSHHVPYPYPHRPNERQISDDGYCT